MQRRDDVLPALGQGALSWSRRHRAPRALRLLGRRVARDVTQARPTTPFVAFENVRRCRRLRSTFQAAGSSWLMNQQYTPRMWGCLLYTSDAADDLLCVDLGGRRIIKKKKI